MHAANCCGVRQLVYIRDENYKFFKHSVPKTYQVEEANVFKSTNSKLWWKIGFRAFGIISKDNFCAEDFEISFLIFKSGETLPNQFGFVENCSTATNIWIFRFILVNSRSKSETSTRNFVLDSWCSLYLQVDVFLWKYFISLELSFVTDIAIFMVTKHLSTLGPS